MRLYFMETERIGFSKWQSGDEKLADLLWGDADVTHFICASGVFTTRDIQNRLNTEIQNDTVYRVQYWPIFELNSSELIGCCGLRPCMEKPDTFEIGFHLRKNYWGKGLACEAARAVIQYAFSSLGAKELRAGHHPENGASRNMLTKLGFQYIEDCYYAPTGLYHPTYCLTNSPVMGRL